MSTDRSRLVSSIRRIVLTDPDLSSALDAWQNRGDQASSTGVGTSDAERDRLCCDGSTSDNPNPGADTRDTSEGGQDGLNADDPALLDSGPGSLTGVTDCATGEPICFDGNDWLPPEGWDDPGEPPVPSGWEPDSGVFWHWWNKQSTAPEIIARTRGQSEASLMSYGESEFPNRDLTLGSSTSSFTNTTLFVDGAAIYIMREYVCGADDWLTDQALIDAWCGTDYGNPSESEIPYPDWPEDGCVNLAIKNGTIVGSKYDPENDGTYSKPMSEIELCDGSGNSFLLRPSASGGWKTIKSLDGEPDGAVQNGWLYSAYGDVIQQITPSEFSDPKV